MMSDPTPVLEPAAWTFVNERGDPNYLHNLGLAAGRKHLETIQAGDTYAPAVDQQDLTIGGGPSGQVSVRVFRPQGSTGTLPVVVYLHGGGWVFGNANTHDRLVRELTVRGDAATLFVNYSLSPEAKYPTALEETYAVLLWVAEHGPEHNLDPERIAIAADSSGGNLAAAATILAKQRGGPRLAGQLLYYPVTDANFNTRSYIDFSTGYWLRRDAMMWFWDQYAPDPEQRKEITVSPLKADTADLAGLPTAMVINGEVDILRDEGEAYAAKLRLAGVDVTGVRYQGAIHDFVMINALRNSNAAREALVQGGRFLKAVLHR